MPALKIPRKWYTHKITSTPLSLGSSRGVKRKLDLTEIRNDDRAHGGGGKRGNEQKKMQNEKTANRNPRNEGERKKIGGKYGSKLWCKRLNWYECENKNDERIRVNAETSEEEYAHANKDTEGKGN